MKHLIEYTKMEIPDESGTLEFIGNRVLYDLCKKYPLHNNKQEVFAKIWLIGRSYAVALERGDSHDNEINDDFYGLVVNKLLSSKIDVILDKLNGKELVLENLHLILGVYKDLYEITFSFGRGYKPSFCSKYLHFHFPELFFIYDSRVLKIINSYKIDISELNELKYEYAYLPYFKFFCKCFLYQNELRKTLNLDLTPRQIDILLINQANSYLRDRSKYNDDCK